MTNIHNFNDINESITESVFYNTIATNNDNKKNHQAVLSKIDIFALLGRLGINLLLFFQINHRQTF